MKILTSLFLLLFFINPALAQTDCPIGMVNDAAPGNCGSYVDKDKNNLCDLSEIEVPTAEKTTKLSEEEFKKRTVSEIAKIYNISAEEYARELGLFLKIIVKTSDSMAVLHDENALCATVAAGIAANIKADSPPATEPILSADEAKKVITPKYNFFPVLFVLLIAYLITYILALKKTISFLTQQRIWNLALTLFFLASGISGILLVIRINYGIMVNWPFDLLMLHVETGIAMAIISFFHLAWHWWYY